MTSLVTEGYSGLIQDVHYMHAARRGWSNIRGKHYGVKAPQTAVSISRVCAVISTDDAS